MCVPMPGMDGGAIAQGLGIPQGPATPVRYDEHMKLFAPVPPPSTPVKYDKQMNLMAPQVRQA